ncbi:C-C motif chemokine 3-like [Rousettus aegyptiacus]|uniref:C-C motif chemokine 3-like n=1 Tax=Rousettus aegyptiacus TaxID=9407 RepID=UPI00078856C3|nr:C-C motif chemokine 3-like [Rousettus aegyptiacus]
MKVLGATVLVLLCTMALCSHAEERMNIAPTCCFSYVSHRIPHRRVVSYFRTSNQCPKHGVVFLTKNGRRICANPRDAWVQEYISHMENTLMVQWSNVPVGSREQK